MTTTWQPDDNQLGNHLATQYRIGKDSKGKVRLGKESVVEKASNQPATNLATIRNSIATKHKAIRRTHCVL